MNSIKYLDMECKTCKDCGRELPQSDFRLTRWGTYSKSCKECCAKKANKTIADKRIRYGIGGVGFYSDSELDKLKPTEVVDDIKRRIQWLQHRGYSVEFKYQYKHSSDNDFSGEVWRAIPDYPGYSVSNKGRVIGKQGQILKSQKDGWGYMSVTTYGKDCKTRTLLVHRAVASAFIPNPNNLSQINHIDENKSNNCVENLEWCTASYNSSYGSRNKTNSCPVAQYSLSGELIATYPSALAASNATGISDTVILRCCRKEYDAPRRNNFYIFKLLPKDE